MKTPVTRWSVPVVALFALATLSPVAFPKTISAILLAKSARKEASLFKLADASGKSVRLSDFRGMPVVLNLWATECGGCVLEIPAFIRLHQSYKDKGLAVVGVSIDVLYENLKNANEGWNRVTPFVSKHQIKYPILMGDDDITRGYDVQALPVTLLLDRKGRIAAAYLGVVNEENLEANIKALLLEY